MLTEKRKSITASTKQFLIFNYKNKFSLYQLVWPFQSNFVNKFIYFRMPFVLGSNDNDVPQDR